MVPLQTAYLTGKVASLTMYGQFEELLLEPSSMQFPSATWPLRQLPATIESPLLNINDAKKEKYKESISQIFYRKKEYNVTSSTTCLDAPKSASFMRPFLSTRIFAP